MTLVYCPLSRLYFGRPCPNAADSILYGHQDIDVSDVLTANDLDSRDLGYDLARERWLAINDLEEQR